MGLFVQEGNVVGNAGVLANVCNGFARGHLSGQKSLNVSAHDEGPFVLQEQHGQGEQVGRSRIAHGITVGHVSREFDIQIREYRRVLRMSSGTEERRGGAVAFMAVDDLDRPGELH